MRASAAALAALLLLGVAGCTRPRTGDFSMSGTLRLLNTGTAGYLTSTDGTCAGAGPYADITDGSIVTVSAGTDALADGALSAPTMMTPTECDWTISVRHIAAGRTRYSVAVGTAPAKTFSEGDMKGNPTITLGG